MLFLIALQQHLVEVSKILLNLIKINNLSSIFEAST